MENQEITKRRSELIQYLRCHDMYVARYDELGRCAETAAEALWEDPLSAYLLGRRASEKNARRLFTLTFRATYDRSVFFSPDDQINALACVLLPPFDAGVTAYQLAAGGKSLMLLLGPEILGRYAKYQENRKLILNRHCDMQKLYCMQVLAVRKKMQNMGIGRTLLQVYTDFLDQHHYSTCLETHRKENTYSYSSLGFQVLSVDTTPDGLMPQWSLFRQPSRPFRPVMA